MIICLNCGTRNEPNTNHCVQCSARLPKLDARTVGGAGTPRQMGKYESLKTSIVKVKTGELTWVEFADWYQGFYDDLTGRIAMLVDDIHKQHGPGWNYYEEFTEEVEAIFAGMEDYETALNQIWTAVDEQDLVAAQSSLKIFLRGAEKLNDACVLNAETVRKLEEGWGYL